MREPGFYWIILDGKPVVAEYRLVGSGLSKFPIGACWIYGDKIIKIDKPTDEPVTALSERLPEPIREKNTPKEHYCCERSAFLKRDKYGNWFHAGLIIDFCPFCKLFLSEPKLMGLAMDPTGNSDATAGNHVIVDSGVFIGGVADGKRLSTREGVNRMVFPKLPNTKNLDPLDENNRFQEESYLRRVIPVGERLEIHFWCLEDMPPAEAIKKVLDVYADRATQQ